MLFSERSKMCRFTSWNILFQIWLDTQMEISICDDLNTEQHGEILPYSKMNIYFGHEFGFHYNR